MWETACPTVVSLTLLFDVFQPHLTLCLLLSNRLHWVILRAGWVKGQVLPHFFSLLKSCKVINPNAHGIHIIETRNYLNKIIYNMSFQQSRWIYPSIAWEGLVKFYEIKSSVKTRLLCTDIVECVVCFFSNERISSLSHKKQKITYFRMHVFLTSAPNINPFEASAYCCSPTQTGQELNQLVPRFCTTHFGICIYQLILIILFFLLGECMLLQNNTTLSMLFIVIM